MESSMEETRNILSKIMKLLPEGEMAEEVKKLLWEMSSLNLNLDKEVERLTSRLKDIQTFVGGCPYRSVDGMGGKCRHRGDGSPCDTNSKYCVWEQGK